MRTAPTTLEECLILLEGQDQERLDVAQSASCRQTVQEALADLAVNLQERQVVADRLNQANHLLELQVVNSDESY
ncbi:hypothetical protein [Prochlorothrix hollandica]|uniref:Uncharacterized protein n=1 Tax=Prochlorothrix hollandica PCC 9006 = CALU 1027 TaxID=317619 RepID=A0A0M2Q2Y5_PROHO|nr:hypothetical protein [Prochlorothrix hollandica]KKJ00962.1 hypothetical protein PROH_00520 [Prochlorothrix hollandica PCC 9006 = CALU 1027]